jgi:hypothetical protein
MPAERRLDQQLTADRPPPAGERRPNATSTTWTPSIPVERGLDQQLAADRPRSDRRPARSMHAGRHARRA